MCSPHEMIPGPGPLRRGRAWFYLVFGAACVAAYGASAAFGRGVDVLTLICCGAKDRELIVGAGEWWRLVSAGFLHANAIHLAGNLLALVALGPVVERLWGTQRFVLIYLAALVAGSLASLAATPGVSVGASGAIFGLFGALVVFSTVHHRFVPRGRRLRLWITLAAIAAIQVALAAYVPYIDHAAHAGGLLMGGLAALVLRPKPARLAPSPVRDGAVKALMVGALAVTAWALGTAAEYARASDWLLATRAEMEPRRVAGGDFTLSVPKGWTYQAPGAGHDAHVFSRPGVALVSIRVIPPRQGTDPALVADEIAAQWTRHGASLVARRDIAVADQAGVEMLFREEVSGERQRYRSVVFPTWGDRLLHVSCVCIESRYRLLEVVFDKILQSIRVPLPQPRASAAQRLWQRLTENPRDADACVAIASYYAQEGRHGAAEQLLRTAIGLRPDDADAHDRLAHLYATARPPYRRPTEAILHARKALAIRGDTPKYLATLAIACEAAGDRAKALDAARRAAALAPDDAGYADLVRRLER